MMSRDYMFGCTYATNWFAFKKSLFLKYPIVGLFILVLLISFFSSASAAEAGQNSKAKDIWTLEYLYQGKSPMGWGKSEGHVKFEISSRVETVSSTGPLTTQGTNIIKSKGTLIVEGRVENQMLTFNPDCNLIVNYGYGKAPLDLFEGDAKITMPLKDGQKKVFRYTFEGSSGKVVWRLTKKKEEQIWRVRITGFEVDDSMKPSKFKDADGKEKVLHKRMKFKWELTGRFKLSKEEGNWIFKSGSVKSAKVIPVVDFVPSDIYHCQKSKYASKVPISTMVGEPIFGNYFGGRINLHWRSYQPEGYVKCNTSHAAFPKTPYEGWFRSTDFTIQIGLRDFPLKDGFSETVTKKQWLRYTISFKRLK